MQQSAACNASHSVEARLSRWLLRARDLSDSEHLPLTQEFLAQMIGAQRNAVSIVAHELQPAERVTLNLLQRQVVESRVPVLHDSIHIAGNGAGKCRFLPIQLANITCRFHPPKQDDVHRSWRLLSPVVVPTRDHHGLGTSITQRISVVAER